MHADEFSPRKQQINPHGFPWKKILGLAALIALFFFIRFFINFKLDWAWFDSLSYSAVFWRNFWARLAIGGALFGGAFILNMFNLYLVYKLAGKPFRLLLPAGIAFLAALIVVGNSGDLWLSILRFFNAQPFGLTDPQFGRDISFYVFKLPFYWLVFRLLNTWLLVSIISALILYFFLLPKGPELTWQNITTRLWTSMQKRALFHVGVMIGAVIFLRAARYRLLSFETLYSQVGSVIGAGAADVGASLPAFGIMMVLSGVTGILFLVFFTRKMRLALASVVVYIIAAMLLTGVYPGLYHRFVVVPNEADREKPYLERNIEYTRLAYGLDSLTEEEYPVGDLTTQELNANKDIIENIRLLDHRPTLSTYGQQQEIRPYYDFLDVDVDRYVINSKMTQVFLAGRELPQDSLQQSRTFNNLMLKYTHGFGLVMSPANSVSSNGMPDYLIKDIPPESQAFKVSEPRIYFGEATGNSVIVNTGLKEFDYPMGDDNQENNYQGSRGIRMTFLNRLFLTIRDMQLKYLLSSYITSDSLYLETRSIQERVRRIAPFLLYDGDPYLVLGADGKMYYMLDAYTVTDKFPYSQAIQKNGYNYIRNSVKISMDTYSGEVNFYIFDPEDPILKVYSKIYPVLFKDSAELPRDLREHVRYPEDLFNIQALMLRDYHMSNPAVFYNKEDRWELAQQTVEGQPQPQEAYYSIIRLPGEQKEEFVIMRTFTPARKQNMVAWLAGRSDGENYGKLLLYKFPKGVQVPGSMQVESMIDQDPVISSQLTLWGQGGSENIRGNLLVYPLGGSLLYVEPLYIESEQNRFPQLRKVFVYYKDRIVMEDNLDKALTALFGKEYLPRGQETPGSAGLPGGQEGDAPAGSDLESLIAQLVDLHKSGQERIKAGDWAGYGRVQEEMEKVIGQLEEGLKKTY